MNDFQQKVWDYLINGGSERTLGLKMLTEDQFFWDGASAYGSKEVLKLKLDSKRYRKVFCEAGLERMRRALLDNTSIKKVQVTLELEIEDTSDYARLGESSHRGAGARMPVDQQDSIRLGNLPDLLCGKSVTPVRPGWRAGKRKIRNATIVSVNTHK